MSCEFCNDSGWYVYKLNAPSPPYKQGAELEYTQRCVCIDATKRPSKNFKGEEA